MYFSQWKCLNFDSLKFVPKGSVNNSPAQVQIMAWRHPGDKPLSEPQWWLIYQRIYVSLSLNELQCFGPLNLSNPSNCVVFVLLSFAFKGNSKWPLVMLYVIKKEDLLSIIPGNSLLPDSTKPQSEEMFSAMSNHSHLQSFAGPPPQVRSPNSHSRWGHGKWLEFNYASNIYLWMFVQVNTKVFRLLINQCQLSSIIILHPYSVIDRCLSQCFSYCLVLSCVHALCLVLLVLVLFIGLHVFTACSLHVLDICTRGHKDFIFNIFHTWCPVGQFRGKCSKYESLMCVWKSLILNQNQVSKGAMSLANIYQAGE